MRRPAFCHGKAALCSLGEKRILKYHGISVTWKPHRLASPPPVASAESPPVDVRAS